MSNHDDLNPGNATPRPTPPPPAPTLDHAGFADDESPLDCGENEHAGFNRGFLEDDPTVPVWKQPGAVIATSITGIVVVFGALAIFSGGDDNTIDSITDSTVATLADHVANNDDATPLADTTNTANANASDNPGTNTEDQAATTVPAIPVVIPTAAPSTTTTTTTTPAVTVSPDFLTFATANAGTLNAFTATITTLTAESTNIDDLTQAPSYTAATAIGAVLANQLPDPIEQSKADQADEAPNDAEPTVAQAVEFKTTRDYLTAINDILKNAPGNPHAVTELNDIDDQSFRSVIVATAGASGQ